MPSGTRQSNTYGEGLRRVLSEIADLKTYPDVDENKLKFLINMETGIISQIRSPADQEAAMQQRSNAAMSPALGAIGGGGVPPLGAPPGAGGPPGGLPMPGGGLAGGGAGSMRPTQPPAGLRMNPSMPPVGELQRLVSQVK